MRVGILFAIALAACGDANGQYVAAVYQD